MQKLSAMRYIRNNKRRVSVLIVSLGMSLVLMCLIAYLLSANTRTFNEAVKYMNRIQYFRLAQSSFGIDFELPYEEIMSEYQTKNEELAENLRKDERVNEVLFTDVIYMEVKSVFGYMTSEVPLVEQKDLHKITERFDVRLCEGRMPENPGEVVVSRISAMNQGFETGGPFMKIRYRDSYKITGIIDYDGFLAYGIKSENTNNSTEMMMIFSELSDIKPLLNDYGISYREHYDIVQDQKSNEEFIKENVTESLDASTVLVNWCVMIIMGLVLIIVYVTYLRDRNSEWCLYSSIGFSSSEIYFAVIRELVFTFVFSFVSGIVLTAVSMFILDRFLLRANGMLAEWYQPETFTRITAAYILLFGILQIPVVYGIHRIRTIDAIDDDMYL